MTDDQQKAEDLLSQSSDQRRHTTEASGPGDADDEPAVGGRVEAMTAALQAIEDGDAPENINVRDARLKALLVGLDETGELGEVVEALAETADQDVDANDPTQSEVARLLMRAGLEAELPELLEDGREAYRKAMLERAEDF